MPQWWSEVVSAVGQEFSDLPDVAEFTRILMRLVLALLLGAAVGFERERSERPAGLRTHMLVAVGSALFVMLPQQAGFGADAVSRVMQGLIAGIGFLGAGTILKLNEREQVKGLTTAASIWVTAAIGVAAGLGREATAVLTTLLVLGTLAILPRMHRGMESSQDARNTNDESGKGRQRDN